ncbi:RNA methyltransferase [Sulfuriflexus sp.]|uniref:RNA methyltransferase n=1 Tax=Sulfuriflexus sp. TaxID=2015443 RepID=UPI0028CED6CB|nr:RNA methyltransferase [Sulfuriflexus sp.]MDT8404051.1 RNA methyltransferase [Sulfuriflexus sp.]
MYENIRIVLVNTSHPGNIGAAARAMKNMGLSQLYLVEPLSFPNADASARASGADDLLARATVCQSLEAAVAGCSLVFGASARLRSLPWPLAEPREAAAQIIGASKQTPVAVVFGREHSGLTNTELLCCNALVHIPCNEHFSSLNVAAAVQVLSYEIHMAGREGVTEVESDSPPATTADVERFFEHLEQALIEIEFLDPQQPRQLMRRLRRLYNRTRLEETEVNILRGILTATQKRVRDRLQ